MMGDMPRWPELSTRARSRSVLLTTLMFAYAVLASGLTQRSLQITMAMLIPVGVVSVLAIRQPETAHQEASPPIRRAVWLWTALLVAGLLWEAWAFFHQPAWDVASYDHPTISSLVEPYLDNRGVRVGAWTLWLYSGFRLVRP